MGIATVIESTVTTMLDNYVTTKSAALCSTLSPLLIAAVTIYILNIGYATARGEVQEPITFLIGKSIRIAMIAGLASSAGTYQDIVVNGITAIQGYLAEEISGATTLGALIDQMAAPFQTLANALWTKAMTGTLIPLAGYFVAAMIVALAEIVIVAICVGFVCIGHIVAALCFAVGPIFIAMAAIPATQKWAESWMGQAFNFVVLNTLLAAAISMIYQMAQQFAQYLSDHAATINAIQATISLFIVCASLAAVVWNINSIASALAGGASISGVGRAIAQGGMKAIEKLLPSGSGGSQGGSMSNTSNSGGGGSGGGGTVTATGTDGQDSSPGDNPAYQRHVMNGNRKSG